MRSGAKPLSQVASRIAELNSIHFFKNDTIINDYPSVHDLIKVIHNALRDGSKCYKKIKIRDGLTLANDNTNKWFFTVDGLIVALKYAVRTETKILILGNSLRSKENFFTEPMHSSRLDICMSDREFNNDELFSPERVKLKFVCNEYKLYQREKYIFIPLLHTII